MSKPIHFIAPLLLSSLLAATGQRPSDPLFPAGIRFPENSRGEAAIAALGARLPEVAAFYGKSPQRLREILRDDDTLWVDPAGELYLCLPFRMRGLRS